MTSKRKTWQEKLADKKDFPKILTLEERFPCYPAVRKMGAEAGDKNVLANPSEVMECMKKVPYGKCTTIVEICKSIAKKYHVQGCCSLTTGIFIMTVANAIEEAKQENKNLTIPYWRTLKADGSCNEKFPGGAEAQKAALEKEGFAVIKKGSKYFVENYREILAKI